MAEAESVSARKATLLNPTEDNETVHVLRRRLFQQDRPAGRAPSPRSLQLVWPATIEVLPPEANQSRDHRCVPPQLSPLSRIPRHASPAKTATLHNFQRVRGMFRFLARSVAHLWQTQPADATSIHPHHIDLGFEPIRQEIVTSARAVDVRLSDPERHQRARPGR